MHPPRPISKLILTGLIILIVIPIGWRVWIYAKRCPATYYNSDENRACYQLQEKPGKAVGDQSIEGIKEGLRDGANVNWTYDQYFYPLQTAAANGSTDVARLLIENGADVNLNSKWDESPLQTEIIYKKVDLAKLLLESGADVCHTANFDDRDNPYPTALDLAKANNDEEAIALLMSY